MDTTINCEYASARFPIKELLEEILQKTGGESKEGVDLEHANEIRDLVIRQGKACENEKAEHHVKIHNDNLKRTEHYNFRAMYSSHDSWDDGNILLENRMFEGQHVIFKVRKGGAAVWIVLVEKRNNGVEIWYDFVRSDLKVRVGNDHNNEVSDMFSRIINLYDPNGEGYRFVTPFLAEEFNKEPEHKKRDQGLTSNVIPEYAEPMSLAEMSRKAASRLQGLSPQEIKKRKGLSDMAIHRSKKPRYEVSNAGYLFTHIK